MDGRSYAKDLSLLALSLFFMYSSSFAFIYLFADETYAFSQAWIQGNPLDRVIAVTQSQGRPILGVFYALMTQAIRLDETGLQLLRVIAFTLSLSVAGYLYHLLRKLEIPSAHALLLVTFVWSQPAFSLFHAYLYLAPFWLGIFASLFSFSLFLKNSNRSLHWKETLGHLLLALSGLLVYQMTPFFLLGLLAFSVLESKPAGIARHVRLFGILIGAATLYTVAFKVSQQMFGFATYGHAKGLLDAKGIADFLAPGYLYVFEFWNYPIPLLLRHDTKVALLASAAVIWFAVVAGALVAEVRESRGNWKNWLFALVFCATSFLPIIADRATGRQHLFLPAVLSLVLVFYYAARRLASPHQKKLLRPLALGVVALVAAGANLGYQRALVGPATRLFSFIQYEMINQANQASRRIVVVGVENAVKGYARRCHEPCTAFFGRRLQTTFHLSRKGLYEVAMRFSGLPSMAVEFAETYGESTPDAIVIDWDRYTKYEAARSML